MRCKCCVSAEIQALVLDGRLGKAIRITQQFYPDLLENNLELLFALRCRQFIEIVNGTEGESVPVDCSLPCVRLALTESGCASDSSFATGNVGSPVSHQSCDTPHRLTTSSQTTLTTDTDRLTNGAPLSLSAACTDKNVMSRNGETHSANNTFAEQDCDMDTSDSDERTLANGSRAQCCMNGSSSLPKYVNVTTVFDSDDGDDDDIDLETVMGKIISYWFLCRSTYSVK